MNIKKRIFLKSVLVTSLLALSVFAATPNTACTIRARGLLLNVTLGGRVSSNGQFCQPLGPLSGVLTALRTGVACTGQEYVLGVLTVRGTCPN